MSQVTSNVIAAHELEYKKFKYSHPTYRYRRVIPMNGSNTTVPIASTIETLLELPAPMCVNFAESYLTFNYTLTAGAANTKFKVWQDTYGLINAISVYDENGTYIGRCENLQNYIKVVGKKNLSLTELLTRDMVLQPIHPSNASTTILPPIPGIAAVNIPSGGGTVPEVKGIDYVTNPISIRPDGTEANVSYFEPRYVDHASNIAAVGSTVTYTVRLKLSDLKDCGILSYNHDFPLTKKYTMSIRFGNGHKAAYTATGLSDPATGADDITREINVTNLHLMLAVEENKDVQNSIMAKATSGEGFNVWVPFLTAYKMPRDGTNQSISQSFTSEVGQRLQKVIHSAFNRVESKNTAYDCDNLGGKKIESYRTNINSNPRQDFQVDCKTNFDDYMINKRFIEGSALINRNVYQFNWFHIDDFTEHPNHEDQPLPVPVENCESGLPLFGPEVLMAGGSITWSSDMITTGNLFHYVWAVGQKLLTVRGVDVTCK